MISYKACSYYEKINKEREEGKIKFLKELIDGRVLLKWLCLKLLCRHSVQFKHASFVSLINLLLFRH